ncbi:MAG TPA: hypothetical protein VGH36_02830, partial [Acetobacteraceae bacterium]
PVTLIQERRERCKTGFDAGRVNHPTRLVRTADRFLPNDSVVPAQDLSAKQTDKSLWLLFFKKEPALEALLYCKKEAKNSYPFK